MPILLPVTDNLLFLNQQKRDFIFPFSLKNVPDVRIDCAAAACEADMLLTELPHPVTVLCVPRSIVYAWKYCVCLKVLCMPGSIVYALKYCVCLKVLCMPESIVYA